MNNMPLGAWEDRRNPVHEIINDETCPSVCPDCGAKIMEFIYSFECDECSWNFKKEYED